MDVSRQQYQTSATKYGRRLLKAGIINAINAHQQELTVEEAIAIYDYLHAQAANEPCFLMRERGFFSIFSSHGRTKHYQEMLLRLQDVVVSELEKAKSHDKRFNEIKIKATQLMETPVYRCKWMQTVHQQKWRTLLEERLGKAVLVVG